MTRASAAPSVVAQWVLDTNVVLDWLVFRDAGVARLAQALDEARIRIVTSGQCREELRRVLAYARLPPSGSTPEQLMARYDAVSEPTNGALRDGSLPRCRDASDQKFLEVARDGDARWLVSKDRALLRLAARVARTQRFIIVSPLQAEAVLAGDAASYNGPLPALHPTAP